MKTVREYHFEFSVRVFLFRSFFRFHLSFAMLVQYFLYRLPKPEKIFAVLQFVFSHSLLYWQLLNRVSTLLSFQYLIFLFLQFFFFLRTSFSDVRNIL